MDLRLLPARPVTSSFWTTSKVASTVSTATLVVLFRLDGEGVAGVDGDVSIATFSSTVAK